MSISTKQKLNQIIDFIEAKYNYNNLPILEYPSKKTNILLDNKTNSLIGVEEAPFSDLLYARKNGKWETFNLPNTLITDVLVNNWNQSFAWGNHSLVGYALSSDLHNSVALGTANGLSLSGQTLSLALATINTSGAMSGADKTKLNNIIVHDSITLGIPNGLSLLGQVLTLSLATSLTPGAMSSLDKIKLDSLINYVHPTGFLNKPLVPLNGNTVISQILVSDEGHVSNIVTRELNLNTIGITASELSVVNDTNIELNLTGNPFTALLEATTINVNWNGLLPISRGGTGNNTFNTNEVLIGNGVNPISTISRAGIDTRTTFPATTHALTAHSDVNITTPVLNQVLLYNGTTWINSIIDINNINFEELDPIFTNFKDTIRNSNTVYAAPSTTNGPALFRNLTTDDIPNTYVRFDINQTLTTVQKQRVLTSIGAQISGAYELAFSKGNVTTSTTSVINLTNNNARLVGISDLIIDHNTSEWVTKTPLSGAFIISNLTIDSYGHVSDWSTRELTLSDLGFQAFDPSTIESTLSNHETRIISLETNFPLLNGDKNYIHLQSTPAIIWTFTHNLNKKPSVTIIDSAGSIILAKLTYIDNNNIELDFNGSATSGEVICN